MSDKPVSLTTPPQGYAEWLAEPKARIHTAQHRATLAVNRESSYLTAVDRQVKYGNPTIGLLLCKSKNKVVAEYALGDKSQPMGGVDSTDNSAEDDEA